MGLFMQNLRSYKIYLEINVVYRISYIVYGIWYIVKKTVMSIQKVNTRNTQ